MLELFIGLIFVLIDFDLVFNGVYAVGLVPDFIGYILLIRGFTKMLKESERFRKMRPLATFMVLYSALHYVLNATGIVMTLGGVLGVGLMIAAVAVPLIILYNVIEGLHDIEIERHCDLKTKKMHKFFLPYAIANVLYVIFASTLANDISILANAVMSLASVGFLVLIFLAYRTYKDLPPKIEEEPDFGEQKKKRPWEEI